MTGVEWQEMENSSGRKGGHCGLGVFSVGVLVTKSEAGLRLLRRSVDRILVLSNLLDFSSTSGILDGAVKVLFMAVQGSAARSGSER